MSDGEKLVFPFEVSDEGSASLGLVQVFLELGVLRFEQHGDLLALHFLHVFLLEGAVGSGMAGLLADLAPDYYVRFLLEGTGPGAMAFLLAVFAVVVVDALHLQVVAVQQILQLLVLLPVENFLHFVDSLFQLIVGVCHDHDVQGLIVLEDILCCLVGASASHCDLAARSLLYEFLGLSSRADYLTDVVGLGVVDCVVGQEDLFELFQGLVVLGRNEPTYKKVYVFLIFMQSSISEMRYLTNASLFLTSRVLILLPSLL